MPYATQEKRNEHARARYARKRGPLFRGHNDMSGGAEQRKSLKTKWIQAGKRTFIQMVKMVPCLDCGVSYPPVAMDFDHVRGTKLFNLNKGWAKAWAAIHSEIEKCDIVCSNCHRVRTMLRRAA